MEEIPFIENKLKKREITFKMATSQIIELGNQLMIEKTLIEGRKYHTIEHPETLIKRAEKFFSVLNLPEREQIIIKIAFSQHDTIINRSLPDPYNIIGTIIRNRGAYQGDFPGGKEGNEAISAREMEAKMKQVNNEAIFPVFSQAEIKESVVMVKCTYPAVKPETIFKEYSFYSEIIKQNPNIKKIIERLESEEEIKRGLLFFQPHIENLLEQGKEIPMGAFVVILGDLGGAGLAGHEEFAREGDLEFQELYVNISNPDNLRRLIEGDSGEDESDRKKVVGAMIGWLKMQTGFVVLQMLRVEKIIFLMKKNRQINETQQNQLRLIFDRFESNIIGTLERAKDIEKEYNARKSQVGSKEAFRYIAQAMHY